MDRACAWESMQLFRPCSGLAMAGPLADTDAHSVCLSKPLTIECSFCKYHVKATHARAIHTNVSSFLFQYDYNEILPSKCRTLRFTIPNLACVHSRNRRQNLQQIQHSMLKKSTLFHSTINAYERALKLVSCSMTGVLVRSIWWSIPTD